MDPGTIISIIEISRKTLVVLFRLKEAFRGDETSRHKLEELEARLTNLNHVLGRTADIPSLLESHPTALDELRRTITACSDLLKSYEHALSSSSNAKANFQRAKLALLDDEKLDRLHDRLNRHVLDLQAWHVAEMAHYAAQTRHREEASTSPPERNLLRKPPPQKSSTLMTDLSGATLYAAADDPNQTAARSTIQWLQDSGLEQDPAALGTSPGSLHRGSLDSVSRLYPKGVPHSNPWARDMNGNFGTPPNMRRIPSVDLISASTNLAASSAAGLGVPVVEPQSNASSASNSSSQVGEVKLLTSRGSFTFPTDSYTVSPGDGAQIVEWSGESSIVRHHVPYDNTGLPFTRPTDKRDNKKENHLYFLPRGVVHKIQIMTRQGEESFMDGTLQYIFTSRKERQKFQEFLRGARLMQSFRGLTITTNLKAGKSIARDVNIKIWTFDDRRSTISFARTTDNYEHEEIYLNCFEEAKKESNAAMLRVRKPAKPEGHPEPPTTRRHSIFSSSKKQKTDPGEPAAMSRRSSTQSVATIDTNDPDLCLPDSLRKLEWLRIEFDEQRAVRADFCKFWTDAYNRTPVSRPMSVTSRQSVSPRMNPQNPSPGSLSTSPVLLSNMFQSPSPRLVPRSHHRTQQSPVTPQGSGQGEWFPSLGPPVIQEETSQDELIAEMYASADASLSAAPR